MTTAEIAQLVIALSTLLTAMATLLRSCQTYKLSKKIHANQTDPTE